MDTTNTSTYKEKEMSVKVERIFTGEKTAKELVVELIKKQVEARGNLS